MCDGSTNPKKDARQRFTTSDSKKPCACSMNQKEIVKVHEKIGRALCPERVRSNQIVEPLDLVDSRFYIL